MPSGTCGADPRRADGPERREGHPAHLVRDLVRETLDLSAILDTYTEPRGDPPYHPAMMTALLLYAYTQGGPSSRKIARACEERVDFMAVTGLQRPDFRTISDVRQRDLPALAGLFVQVLRLCRKAGLVTLGHVALDGTKLKANASTHKAMSYGRMRTRDGELEAAIRAEVDRLLAQAEATDAAEDAQLGREVLGDELPEHRRTTQRRLDAIRKAKEVSADAGYSSDDNLRFLARQRVEAFIPSHRQRHTDVWPSAPRGRIPQGLTRRQRMACTLLTLRGRARYALRKITAEPVCGQIKQARGCRGVLLRGAAKARADRDPVHRLLL